MHIKDLFGYNWYCRRKFLGSMAEIPWEMIVRSCGASFDSIRDIFVHSLQAEQVWIKRLNGESTEGIFDPFTKFSDLNAIREYADRVEAETNEYLERLTDEKLMNVFEFAGRDGKINRHRIEDILVHIVEEEIHHRGELLCIYWQNDIRPPYTSFMTYKGQVQPV